MDAAEQRRMRREARQAKILASKGSRMQQVSGGMAEAEVAAQPTSEAQISGPDQGETASAPDPNMSTTNLYNGSDPRMRLQKDREDAQALLNTMEAEETAQQASKTTPNPADLLNAMQTGMNTPEDMQNFLSAMGAQLGGTADGSAVPNGMFFATGSSGASRSDATGAPRAGRGPTAAGSKQAPQPAGLETLFQFSSSASDFMNRGKKAAPEPIRRTLYVHILFAIGLAALFLYTMFSLPRGEDDDTHTWSLHRLLFEGSMDDLGGISEWLTIPFQLFVLNESVILVLDKLQQPAKPVNENEMHLMKIFNFLSGAYKIFTTVTQDLAVFCGVFLCVMMSPLVVARISALFDTVVELESS